MKIGEKIRDERIKRNMSQKTLADKAKISPSYLCDIEVGRSNPSLKTLEKISMAFNVSLSKLL